MLSIGQGFWEPMRNVSAFPEFAFASNAPANQEGEGIK
jgi:hypothetical protein